MFLGIFNKFGADIYVQIWMDRIKVTDVNTQKVFDEHPLIAIETKQDGKKVIVAIGNDAEAYSGENVEKVNPFLHPRVLFSNFHIGEIVLRYAIQKVLGKTLFFPAPLIVIHPMEELEGGLTMIEKRAFRELPLAVGAREVYVYFGPTLSTQNFDLKYVKQQEDAVENEAGKYHEDLDSSIVKKGRVNIWLVLYFSMFLIPLFLVIYFGN